MDVDYAYPAPPGQVEFLYQGSRKEQGWVLQAMRRMPATADQNTWIKYTSLLAERNDILRTCWLQASDATLIGVVLRNPNPDVTRISCQDEKEAASVFETTWDERFVFGKPFIRYKIITYPDGSWDLITKMDHAVYDGTFLGIFDDHYSAILKGQPAPRHTTFKDFAFYIFEQDKSKCLEYWRERPAGWAGYDSMGARNRWINASTPMCNTAIRRPLHTTNVDQLASDHGVTPAIFFQGAFQVWLSRATNSSDVAFDYLLTGRNVDLPDPQIINGTTANFLPMRIKVGPEDSIVSFLRRTQDDFWAMTDHSDVGLVDIYKTAGLERKRARSRSVYLPAFRTGPV
ncbi:uncharacterized protein PgNI_02634 [Pyricularia grisea]|uniref:Condensation domain-containing protein n=1 Tax=Pyricularia grisea TaxID=148305 RepID=A0A6P8BDG5_PYRGI|nr:uncharacterized protein PgNI_02634 [Pyricularia grisea]TLD13916.1 hypothetical protein PgNI_02634 [Pyricularia grisea]